MSLASLQRIYSDRIGVLADDLWTIKPNMAVVEPVREPEQTTAGLYQKPVTPRAAGMHVIYRVVALGPLQETRVMPGETLMTVSVGDIVCCRNAMFDPLGANLLAVELRHILAVLQPSVASVD